MSDFEAQFVGLGSCKGGWCLVSCSEKGEFEFGEVISHLSEAEDVLMAAELILVGLPVVHTDSQDPERSCDFFARRLLGPQASTVLSPPPIQAVQSKSLAAANSAAKKIGAKAISKQMWNLVPRLRELSDLLEEHRDLRFRMFESHPELCFYGLLGGEPLPELPNTDIGRLKRERMIAALTPLQPLLDAFQAERLPKNVLSKDDVISAAVLSLTAFLMAQSPHHQMVVGNEVASYRFFLATS